MITRSRRTNFFHVALAVATSIALLLSGCSVLTTEATRYTSLQQFQNQNLKWKSCYEDFQCSILKVPIDYTDFTLGTFDIALLRYRDAAQHNWIGSLVVNPGGPGASGVQFAYNAEYIVSHDILERYDIVGFDPRGVGDSSAIHCRSDKETDASFAADAKPDSASELNQLIKSSQEFIRKCEKKTEHLNHFSTAQAARDMDLLRSALGDTKLNFLGKSYGSYLGLLYADLFPEKVGRIVLDGATDPNASNLEASITQARGFDLALNAFMKDCFKKISCPLPKGSTSQYFTDLFQSANKTPLISKTDRVATEALVVLGTASALYDNASGWPQLRRAIKQAQLGKGDEFLNLADQYTGRQLDGKYFDNQNDAGAIIHCLDRQRVSTLSEIKENVKLFVKAAPVFGPYVAYGGIVCNFIPHKNPPANLSSGPVSRRTANPIVIVGTTRDPATPYKWALSLHKYLKGSVLITLDADGHTGHNRGSGCVDGAIDRYLLTGIAPTKDLACSMP